MNKFKKYLVPCLDFLFQVFIYFIFIWCVTIVLTMTISLPKTGVIIAIASICIAIICRVCDYYKNRKIFKKPVDK